MTINRIDTVTTIVSNKPSGVSAGRENRKVEGDSVSISSEAMKMAEFREAFAIVQAAPVEDGLSPDRLADLRAKINDPAYFTDEVFGGAADNIIESLFS